MSKRVLYITATLPALTVTFIYKEIYRLRALGVAIDCVSMNTPSPDEVSEDSQSLLEETTYLDSVGYVIKILAFLNVAIRHPRRTATCLKWALFGSPVQGLRDRARLLYHVVEAGYLCRRLDMQEIGHIHAHFINGPTSIAMFLSTLSGTPFSFTMHASMIWLDPIAVREKLRSCAFCASISEYNRDYVVSEYGDEFRDKIRIVHCGIDPEAESLAPPNRASTDRLQILGVGQLNRRKGFHVLVDACKHLLETGLDFECTIVGGGEERQALENQTRLAGLDDRVRFTGPVKHERVNGLIEACDLFVLPCVISEDGWRDGIPVALMEAMFNRRAVISSRILGLPELIDDGKSGRLVEANDAKGLAVAIAELAASPDTCREYGENARRKVLQDFNNLKSAQALQRYFSA